MMPFNLFSAQIKRGKEFLILFLRRFWKAIKKRMNEKFLIVFLDAYAKKNFGRVQRVFASLPSE
jgi:hypothetical protein